MRKKDGTIHVTKDHNAANDITTAIIPKPIIDFLNIRLINEKMIIFNIWDILHFIYGIIHRNLFGKNSLLLLLIIHTFWEISEVILVNIPSRKQIMYPREIINAITDTLLAMLGYLLTDWYIGENKEENKEDEIEDEIEDEN